MLRPLSLIKVASEAMEAGDFVYSNAGTASVCKASAIDRPRMRVDRSGRWWCSCGRWTAHGASMELAYLRWRMLAHGW